MRDLVREFLTYIQVEKGLARHTIQSYRRDLKRLEEWAATQQKTVSDLSRSDLRKWIAQLSREGLAPTSVARAVSAVRGFYRFLMLDGHIKHQPTEDLDTPQRFAYLPKFLTEDEINRLFAAPDISTPEGIRDRAMFELMYAAGLRVSEMTSLKEADLEINSGLVKCHGKGSKERRVPLGKSAIHWLPISRGEIVVWPQQFALSFSSRRSSTNSSVRLASNQRARRSCRAATSFPAHAAS